MRRNLVLACAACATCGLMLLPGSVGAQAMPRQSRAGETSQTSSAEAAPPLVPSLDAIAAGLTEIERTAESGDAAQARQLALRLYLDRYEIVESTYGVGGGNGTPELAARIGSVEGVFHELLRAGDSGTAARLARTLRGEIVALRPLAEGAATAPARGQLPRSASTRLSKPSTAARAPAVRAILAALDTAEGQYRAGRNGAALVAVERVYLDDVEPLEPKLPQSQVHALERLVHLGVRARLAAGAPPAEVAAAFTALRAELGKADAVLAGETPGWLGAVNAFAILVREGLEAVLLIAALLAYLAATGAGARERRRIWGGVGAGVLATAATWVAARLVIPMGGASRELVEGITGLIAVVVLMYVSNWLFQKTYIHDWKDYLRRHVGEAVATGSGLAMAALAFAAVYREGFETVLFYQALLYDAGPIPVLAGAIPGAIAIGLMGLGIIRLGVKLPLRRVFAVTNAILVYLAFGFVGKGLYNLQEAGLYAPHPLSFLPDVAIVRQLFGIYPIAETLGAQAAFAVVVLATYLYHRRALRRARMPASPPAAAAATATHATIAAVRS